MDAPNERYELRCPECGHTTTVNDIELSGFPLRIH